MNLALSFLWMSPVVAQASVGAAMIFLIVVPMSILFLVRGYEAAKKHLLIKNTPTSDCGGVSPGQCELKAEVAAEGAMNSPLTDEKVVFYDYSVKEQVQGSDNSRSWRDVASESKRTAFYIHDDTGRVRVDPRDAEIHPDVAVDQVCTRQHELYDRGPANAASSSTGRRQFEEKHLAVGQEVYIIGPVRHRGELGVPELSAGAPDEPFIISARDEGHLVDEYSSQARLQLFFGFWGMISTPALATVALEGVGLFEALEMTLVPTFVLGLMVIGAIWGMYRMSHRSHLEDLKKRMDRAEAILQRETGHRERLLDEIASMVKGVAERYSQKLIDDAIEHRAMPSGGFRGLSIRQICPIIDGQSDALEVIFEVAKESSELSSKQEFRNLLEDLTRCEKQLMMARNFYNEGNFRLSQEPESRVGEYQTSRTTLTFEPFEQKPIDVVLPEDPQDEYGDDAPRKKQAESESYMGMDISELSDGGNEESTDDDATRSKSAPNKEEPPPPPAPNQNPPPTPQEQRPVATAESGGDEQDKHEKSKPSEVDAFDEYEKKLQWDEARQRLDGDDVDPAMGFDELDSGEKRAAPPEDGGLQMESSLDFGDLGQFGDARRFDDLGADDGEQSPKAQKGYGFDSQDFGGAGKLTHYEGFGFTKGETAQLGRKDGFPSGEGMKLTRGYGFEAGETAEISESKKE